MSVSNCKQLKDFLERINFYFTKFNDIFGGYNPGSSILELDKMVATRKKINRNVVQLQKEVEASFTNTENGEKYPSTKFHAATGFDAPLILRANVRKKIEVGKGNFLKVGEIITLGDNKSKTEYTVVGFQVETNGVIASYIEFSMGGLRKKKKYVVLKDRIALRNI